ncbi:hypothetical protein OSB04_014270 [Centaurea solstitialis]|uniref:Retrotransposon gag domain-containing protein n=1 Tax=Centaurea solstitialis TaxID=347529 RepID=A0AA38T8T1_9ASTR|nr:hypothetical protein OSB04_014270 [Centaurea solstitialis]
MKRGRSKNQTVDGEAVVQAVPSTGQVNGRRRGRSKQTEETPTTGVDLNTQPTENSNPSVSALQEILKSTVPIIVEEITRKIQDERRVPEEHLESSRTLREAKDREWKHRKKFFTARPREFHGALDPIMVSDWITEMENVFDICECSEDQKVLYASFMLRGNALHWWNAITESHGKEIMRTMLWDQFKALVYKNFSPKNLIRRLEESFINLRQGNMSVQRYATEFLKLARFGSVYVSTTDRKITRFIEGLNAEIRSQFVVNCPKTFEEVVEVALIAENGPEPPPPEAVPTDALHEVFEPDLKPITEDAKVEDFIEPSKSLEVKKDDIPIILTSQAPDQIETTPMKAIIAHYPFELDEVSLMWKRSQRYPRELEVNSGSSSSQVGVTDTDQFRSVFRIFRKFRKTRKRARKKRRDRHDFAAREPSSQREPIAGRVGYRNIPEDIAFISLFKYFIK